MKHPLNIAILESIKPNELRIPLHPKHFKSIRLGTNRLVFQAGYAKHFGAHEQVIRELGFYLVPRNELLKTADVIFLLKLTPSDLNQLKHGATVVGWCHAAQQLAITNIAQKRNLTLIAMEAMYDYEGKKHKHLFRENNFIAGYVGIEHALESVSYRYNKNAKVVIISYGTVSQGAATRLVEQGFTNITVFSRREKSAIENKLATVTYELIYEEGSQLYTATHDPLKNKLLAADIIINGIMQDILMPYNFLSGEDLRNKKNKLIVDLSCDEAMGFDFARATGIDKPILNVGENFYYGVDHVPTLAWQSISAHISEQLLPVINSFLGSQFDQAMNGMLKNATEIRKGKIVNQTISKYQDKISR